MRTRQQIQHRRRRADLAALFFIFLCVIGGLAALGLTGWTRQRNALERLGPAAPALNPAIRFVLGVYLASHLTELETAASADETPLTFSVQAGETAGQVAERLAAEQFIADAQLLNLYLRYRGFDNSIEAGDFILRRNMTPVEVAAALTDAQARELTVRVIEGWRLEQVAASLSADPRVAVAYEDFMALTGSGGGRAGGFSFSAEIPPGASLEGFLFPDTYIVKPGASAAEVLDKMLANFDAHLPAAYRTKLFERNLTLYQAVTIASLIEREAVQDDERPIIASVILNRLVIGQPLEIDATVQYAIATAENWWPPVGGLDFRAIENPYNTYFITGLPAGPIANPGEASLLAVADPADTNYLYYRALCDGSGRHAFAATYEEHLANGCQ